MRNDTNRDEFERRAHLHRLRSAAGRAAPNAHCLDSAPAGPALFRLNAFHQSSTAARRGRAIPGSGRPQGCARRPAAPALISAAIRASGHAWVRASPAPP